MKIANIVAFIILAIGGLNWLVLGIFGTDFVALIAGSQLAALSRIVYILVGLSTLYLIFIAVAYRAISFRDGRE